MSGSLKRSLILLLVVIVVGITLRGGLPDDDSEKDPIGRPIQQTVLGANERDGEGKPASAPASTTVSRTPDTSTEHASSSVPVSAAKTDTTSPSTDVELKNKLSAGEKGDDDLAAEESALPGGGGGTKLESAAPGVVRDVQPHELPPSVDRVASVEQTYRFFQNILLIVMMSPGRYPIVRDVKRHYEPYFKHIYFTGPLSRDNKNPFHVNDTWGVNITEYDIVYGNEQYRAVSRIIRRYEESPSVEENTRFEGYLYVADDLMLHPWALAAEGRKNKTVPWAVQMGIANLKSSRPVNAVPGMSIEPQFRLMWPYWRKNRPKLSGAVRQGGDKMREMLRRSARMTPGFIYRKSKYRSAFMNDRDLLSVTFFTIVDTYYIPKHLAIPYADQCDLMAKNWVFGECAIATAIRAISPVYQEMAVQFYWAHKNCPRSRWHQGTDGFHRCRHDHPFAHAMFDHEDRAKMHQNASYLKYALSNQFTGKT